jgi:putative oxidoreductase
LPPKLSGYLDAASRLDPLSAHRFEITMRYCWPADAPGRWSMRFAAHINRAFIQIPSYQGFRLALPASILGTISERTKMNTLNTSNILNNNTSAMQSIGRIMIAVLFLASAVAKLMAPGPTIAFIASSGLPFATLGFLIAVTVELGGGLLLAFGIQTRAIAVVLAIFTMVTGLAFHHEIGNPMQLTELLKNIAITGGLLHIVAMGARTAGMPKAARA